MTLVVPFEEIFKDRTGLLADHESWERVELGRVSKVLNGFAFKSSSFNKTGGFPVIRIRDLARGATGTFYKGEFPEEYIVENGDLLIGMDGLFGCYEWHGGRAGLNQRVCKIVPDESFLNRKFLFFGVNGYLKAIQDATSSVTVGHLSSRDILRIPFPLPPLTEQIRIVAKLEDLLTTVDSCQKRLAKIPLILKRFRQSVLAAACSGALTSDWRESNSRLAASAPAFLKLIRERRDANVTALFDNECPEDSIPPSWLWVRFGDVIGELRNGVPSRPNFEPPGVPILRISAARPGRVDLRDVRYMPRGDEFLPQYKLADRDLLFTRYNGSLELLGVCGMVRDLRDSTVLYPDKLMRVRFDNESVKPEYVEVFFQAPSAHERVIAKAKSSAGQNGVSGADIKSQPLALPPLPEQEEIVRRVESLFKFADLIEARYQKAQGQVDKLTQSILAKAFRGELVPTEAELARREGRDYESASALLERVRREQENSPAVSTKRVRSKASTAKRPPNSKARHEHRRA